MNTAEHHHIADSSELHKNGAVETFKTTYQIHIIRNHHSRPPLTMKLDTTHLRYLTPEDWRVLTAVRVPMPISPPSPLVLTQNPKQQVETGSKNHEIVPTRLITQLSNLRSGSGAHRSISTLAKANLIARVQHAKCMIKPSPFHSPPHPSPQNPSEKTDLATPLSQHKY